MRVIIVLLLNMSIIFGLNACVANPKIQTPLGFTLMVIDIPCQDVVNSIPTKLEKRDIPSVWIDKNQEILSVGPVMERSGGVYSKIQHSYELSITCNNELSTSITGKAVLEGLNADNKWVSITDVQTVENVALKFLRSLEL
jgi:hypothetical protein